MFFSKCFPTNTSVPSSENDESNKIPSELTSLPFTKIFAPAAASAEQVEPTEPYKYIKEGNVEKILEGLRNYKFHPGFAWKLAMKYPKSPALYLFTIDKLPMEDLKDNIVAALKEKNILEELPPIMEQSYGVLARRSYRDVHEYDNKVLNSMVQMNGLFRLSVVGEAAKGNDKWSELYDAVNKKRTVLMQLHKPKPTFFERCCCPMRRAR